MRLRHTLGAALGALALIATLPTPAHAIPGKFLYKYGDPASPSEAQLENPSRQACQDIPEVVDTPNSAFAPANHVQSVAWIYTGEGCTGTKTVMEEDEEAGNDIKFKAVYFPDE